MSNNRPTSYYTTPERVGKQLDGSTATDIDETNAAILAQFGKFLGLVKTYCYDYSEIIQRGLNRSFVVYAEAKSYNMREYAGKNQLRWSSTFGAIELKLGEDLLAVNSITVAGTALTSDQYRLTNEGNQRSPYRILLFDSGVSFSYDFTDAIVIDAEWGANDHPNNLYATIEAVPVGGFDDNQTELTGLTAGTADSLYETFQYLRINDELMLITSIDLDTSVLTVERGVNGFTAAAHLAGADVTRWNVSPDMLEIATRLVNFSYAHRTVYGDIIQLANGTSILPADLSRLIVAAQNKWKLLYIEVAG